MPDLSHTPGVYYALAYGLSCTFYMLQLPRRLNGARLAAAQGVFLAAITTFMVLTDGVPAVWFIPCVCVYVSMMLLDFKLCCGMDWLRTGYVCVRAFILGEFAAALEWQLFYFGLTALGLPLLWDDSDCSAIIDILDNAYPVGDDEILLLMGHGTRHGANDLYVRLSLCMEMRRGERMALCTIDGTPTFEDAIARLKAQPRRRVRVAPLLLVAGDHAKNDMAGEKPDSLRRRLEREGFQVSCEVRGLGEIPAVRQRLVSRARAAYEALNAGCGCAV